MKITLHNKQRNFLHWVRRHSNIQLSEYYIKILEDTLHVYSYESGSQIQLALNDIRDLHGVQYMMESNLDSIANKNEIALYLARGEKLGAIKYVKKRTGLGLREAKNYIDNYT